MKNKFGVQWWQPVARIAQGFVNNGGHRRRIGCPHSVYEVANILIGIHIFDFRRVDRSRFRSQLMRWSRDPALAARAIKSRDHRRRRARHGARRVADMEAG
jgi:hypothetical protein